MSIKILAVDIETSPALSWHYGMFGQNFGLDQVERVPDVIGWATRWKDEGKATCTWYDGPAIDGFTGSLHHLWRQLDQATHTLHYNGDRFDIGWINKVFAKYGIDGTDKNRKPGRGVPPSPTRSIDLLKQVKARQRNLSNKLQFVSTEVFDLPGKTGDSALKLWLEMHRAYERMDMKAYEKARAKMARYCRQDVNLLPDAMDRYLPWMTGINANLYNGLPDSCPNCGSERLERRGYLATTAGNYQRYRCKKCGTWSKGNRGLEFSTVRNAK